MHAYISVHYSCRYVSPINLCVLLIDICTLTGYVECAPYQYVGLCLPLTELSFPFSFCHVSPSTNVVSSACPMCLANMCHSFHEVRIDPKQGGARCVQRPFTAIGNSLF